jgi:hypothetical protein
MDKVPTNGNLRRLHGEGYNGLCRHPNAMGYDTTNKREQKSIARDMIIGCYAGIEAQRLVDPPKPFHGQKDESDAFELSRDWCVFPAMAVPGR